ncbi:MAG: hypothetical protein GVY35_06940 [Bacteroidetes bacterium]|jgi:hypothetical protein|nr:hypothetical protein [Bacteroidota bacterium]
MPTSSHRTPVHPADRLILLLTLLFVATAGLRPSAAHAQEKDASEPSIYADSLTHLEDWGSYAVAVANERLYFGSGNQLIIADASAPGRIREISRLRLPYLVRDVHVAGEYVYVANDAGGLRVVDVTDPVEPTEVASIAFDDRVDAVDVQGTHAYVAARSAGLHILNIANPDQPRTVGHYATEDQVAGVAVDGAYAHVAAVYDGHRILDVSAPTQPEEVGFAIRGSYDQGYAWDVAVSGDHAYVANVEIGLRRVDITNPADAAPTVELLQTVHHTNDNRYRAEVLDRPAAVEIANDFAFVADQNAGLRIVDLSDPDTLRIVGTADTPGRALDVAVAGTTAFVADQYAGIRVIDVSDPFAPAEIGFWDADQQAVQVTLADGALYLADQQNGLWRLDPASPADVTPTGFYHFPELNTFAVDGSRAVVGNGARTLRLLDLSDPQQPREHGTLTLPAPAADVHLASPYAYVTAQERGLRIIDVSNPDAPREVAAYVPDRAPRAQADTEFRYYPDPPSAWAITASGDTAFVSFDDGLHVLDLSDPARPRRIGRYDHTERAMQTALRDGRLFAAFDDGLHILDVSNPANPKRMGTLDTPSYARAVALDGPHLYLGDLTGGVLVVDVSDPTTPRLLSRVALERSRVVDVAYDGNGHVFVAGTSGGLKVIDVSDPQAPRLLNPN